MQGHDWVTTTVRIPARKLTLLLGWGIALLSLASLLTQALHFYVFTGRTFASYERIVDLSFENNIPTWYSSALLLVASLLLFQVSRLEREKSSKYAFHWAALSTLFLLFSADEVASIHERTTKPLRHLLRASGFLYYTWVIPGLLVVLVVGLASLKFLWHLPPGTRRRLILAGCLYVGGAVGMEMIGGDWAAFHGENGFTYFLLSDIEETLEMVGVLVLIHALLAFMKMPVESSKERATRASLGRQGT